MRRARGLAQATRACVDALEPRRLLSVSFPTPVGYPSTGVAQQVAVADFNGDGKPDFVVSCDNNSSSATVQVAINNGDGTFAAPITLPYSEREANSVTVGDFNGDGVKDIAVDSGEDGAVTVYLGSGSNINSHNPSFLPPVVTVYGSTSSSEVNSEVMTGHFGGTSDDLVVSDQNDQGKVLVLQSSGGGHFTVKSTLQNTQGDVENFSTLTLADFTGDGVSDIAYAAGNTVIVQFGVGGGSFLTSTETYTVPDNLIEQIAAGVLTASGKMDIVAANDTANGSSPAEVSVLINNGGGGFAAPVNYPAGTSAAALALGDFDGNGSLDIVSRVPSVGVNFFANSGSGTFAPAASVSMSTDTFGMVAADLNSDVKADLVLPDTDFSTGVGRGDAVTIYLEGATSGTGGGGGGGGTTTPLTGTVSGKVPPSVIAGHKVALSQNVTLTNNGSTTLTGKVTAKVFLASGTTTDSGSILLTTVSKSAKLKPHARLPLHFSIPKLAASVPNGTYHIVVAVTDPNGGTTDIASTGTITVAPPEIDLSGSFVKPPTVSRTHQATLNLTLKNTGNTAAVGTLGINILTSLDGLFNDEVLVTKISKHVNIAPSKPFRLTAAVTLPIGDAFVVADLDPSNVFKDVNLANNAFETLQLVNVS